MSRMSNGFACGAVSIGIGLFASDAMAGYELYNKDETKLDLNLQVVGAQIGQSDPWFGEQHAFLNVSANHWTEFGTEFGLSGETTLGDGTLFSEFSGVYTRSSGDDSSGVTAGLDNMSKTTLEQAHLGWKKADVFAGLQDDTVTVQLGRFDYSIGTGMLVNDGGADGGDRGGWYIGLRKAFQNGAMVSLDSKHLKAQVFHLKNNPRRGGNQGEGNGANVDYTFGDTGVSFGASYLNVDPQLSGVDKLDVYDARAQWQDALLPGLSFAGEFAHEKNNTIDGDGYYAQVAYAFVESAWTPAFTYRYARFDSDFSDIAYGFTDYGYWIQGEIAGNYPLSNVNLKSNMLRANLKPLQRVELNVFYYRFALVEPAALAPGVTSDDFGDEVDITADWKATDRIDVTGVLGCLMPGDAAQQWVGGDDDWLYAMLYVSFRL
jgi:predicted porin